MNCIERSAHIRKFRTAAGCIVLLLLALPPRDIIAQVVSTDRAAIVAAAEGFHGALAQGDRAAALALLALDAAILESGHLQTRAEYEREHLGEDIAFARATTTTRSPLAIQQEGNAAWTTATSRTTGTFNGRKIDSTGVELIVLTKTESGWRIRAIHWSSHEAKGK
jgi:ketosteroid isomerase-like protein